MKTNPKFLFLICALLAAVLLLASCGQTDGAQATGAPTETAAVTLSSGVAAAPIADGIYTAEFKTDSSMFHVCDAYDGRGILTVKDGAMTIHVSLVSKNTQALFRGAAKEAIMDHAVLLQPSVDTVHYPDGTTDEVHGFDIPVPYLDAEFECALIGKKGIWYDHMVSVSDPLPTAANGDYTAEVTLTGGSGKASVASPASILVENGKWFATLVFSSSHYEYVTVGDMRYDRLDTEGNSTFFIPVVPDEDMQISALTTAMSEPHLIDYTLRFDGATLRAK